MNSDTSIEEQLEAARRDERQRIHYQENRFIEIILVVLRAVEREAIPATHFNDLPRPHNDFSADNGKVMVETRVIEIRGTDPEVEFRVVCEVEGDNPRIRVEARDYRRKPSYKQIVLDEDDPYREKVVEFVRQADTAGPPA